MLLSIWIKSFDHLFISCQQPILISDSTIFFCSFFSICRSFWWRSWIKLIGLEFRIGYWNVMNKTLKTVSQNLQVGNMPACWDRIWVKSNKNGIHCWFLLVLTASTCSLEYSLASISFLTLFDTRVYSSSICLY